MKLVPGGLDPANGQLVCGPCVFCGREPRAGERYGTRPEDWDAPAQMCPECWDALTGPEEE